MTEPLQLSEDIKVSLYFLNIEEKRILRKRTEGTGGGESRRMFRTIETRRDEQTLC